MGAILLFVESPLGRQCLAVLAVLAIVLGIGAEIYHRGVKHETAKVEARQSAAKADVVAHEAKAAGITVQAVQGLSAARTANAQHIATLTKRIPADVPPEADVDCRIPGGFVSLWNAGAASVGAGVPSPASGSEKPAS